MKFEVNIKAVLNEKDPAHTTIARLGVERTIEKFKKDLAGAGMESVEVEIKEVANASSEN